MSSFRSGVSLVRTCLRTHTIITRASTSAPSFRSRAFTSSSSLSKKNRSSALESEEFEEDIIEEDDSSSSNAASSTSSTATGSISSSSSSDPLDTAVAQKAKRAAIYNALSSESAKSSFHLRSNIPATSTVLNLIRSSDRSEIPSTLEQIAILRQKVPVVLSNRILPELVSRCCSVGLPEAAVTVLEDRAKYGLDLEDLGLAHRLAWELGQNSRTVEEQKKIPSKAKKEKSTKAAFKLLALADHYLPETRSRPLLPLFVLSAAVHGGAMEDAKVLEILERVKAMGQDELYRMLTSQATTEQAAADGEKYPKPSVKTRSKARGAISALKHYYDDVSVLGQTKEQFFTGLHERLREHELAKRKN